MAGRNGPVSVVCLLLEAVATWSAVGALSTRFVTKGGRTQLSSLEQPSKQKLPSR